MSKTPVGLLIILLSAASAADAQERVFAAGGGTLYELSVGEANLGSIQRSWPIPPNTGLAWALFSFNRGRQIGWTFVSPDGVLKLEAFDVASGTFSLIPIAGNVAPSSVTSRYIGASDERSSLLFVVERSVGPGLVEWHVPTRTILRTIDLRGGCFFGYAYASATNLVFVRRSSRCVFGTAFDAQWVDVIDLTSSAVRERAFDMPFGFGQLMVTDAAGSRLWVATTDNGYPAPASVGVFDTTTGALLAVNTAIDPEHSQFPGYFERRAPNVLLTVTESGLVGIDDRTLQPIANTDVPRYRLSAADIPSGYRPVYGYQVLTHPAARTFVVYEWAAITYNYHGGPCLQAAMALVDAGSGQRRAYRNVAEAAGAPVCGVQLVMTVPS